MLWRMTKNELRESDLLMAMIVRAPSERKARILAADRDGYPDDWLNHLKSKCEVLHSGGSDEIIMEEKWTGTPSKPESSNSSKNHGWGS